MFAMVLLFPIPGKVARLVNDVQVRLMKKVLDNLKLFCDMNK